LTISSIIFDLDETLIDREATMMKFLIKQRQRLSGLLNCGDIQYANSVLKFQNGGYANKRTAFQFALIELNQEERHLDSIVRDFESTYGNEAIAFPGVRTTLLELKKDFSLGLISNGRSKGQRNKIRSSNLDGLFDVVVISEEVGVKKPDPSIFVHCLELLSVKASCSAYVGDNPANDIEPANKLGMISIWVENSNFEAPHDVKAIISNISDLTDTISALCLT
jgi:putative hydrolase of the HAD superfamily